MASKIIGITVDIEGKTSSLTKSLQDANSSINKTTSALKDVNNALKLDPTNVELLEQKELLLNKQIDQTNEKLEILSQVAADANDALARGDITQEQYASLTAEISKTESALGALETEAEGSSDALEDVADSASDTGDEASEASVDVEALGEAAQVAGEVAVAAFEAIVVAAAAIGTAVIAAMSEATTALVNATVDAAALSDEILTLSSTTGLATDTIQELNYASSLLDVETSTITGSMTKLLTNMNNAADGTESAIEKFDELGIAFTNADGSLRATEDVFWDAIDTLGEIENETERDAAAMELFGKSAKELNPLIEAGSDAFADLAEEAHEVGYVMSEDTLDSFGAFQDNLDRLTNISTAVSNSFGMVLLPTLTELSDGAVELLGDFSGALAQADGDVEQIASVIEQYVPQAVALVEKYVPQILTVIESVVNALLPVIISVAPQLITLVANLISQLANSISENADSFLTAFSALFESVANSVITILPVLIPIAINLIMTLVNALIENAPLLVEGALSIIDTLCTDLLSAENIAKLITGAASLIVALANGLTTALPTLIPTALNAILTIVETLLSSGALADIIKAAMTLIITLGQALIDYLPELIARLPEIIVGIVEFLTGDALPQITNAGQTLLLSIVANLPDIIAGILGALIEIVAQMCDYIVTDGAEDLAANILSVFGMLNEDALTWGADLIGNFIDGIKSMFGSLTSAVSSAASTVSDYLHFSEPEKGPLSDFNESGADMIDNFIKSMDSEQTALEAALNETASIIGRSWESTYDISANAAINGVGGTAAVGGMAQGGTFVFPIYLGGDLLDTVVIDALDLYNYRTGGH